MFCQYYTGFATHVFWFCFKLLNFLIYCSIKEDKARSFCTEKDRTLCETVVVRNMVRQKRWKSSLERRLTTFKQENKGFDLV